MLDRKNSIEKAITDLFPLSHHGFCTWHMEKNLIQRYNNASSIFQFKRAATTYRVEEFKRLMGQLRRVSGRSYGYLEQAGFPLWSRALIVGQQYNIMTNNNAESLNSMLRHARSLPIMHLVEHIRSTMQKWFYERRRNAIACSTLLRSRLESELRTTFEASIRLRAHAFTDNLTQVGISNDTNIIDFSDNTCTCREFHLNHIPCLHATRTAWLGGRSLYDLCFPYYTSKYWRGAYNEAIYLVGREVDWVIPNDITGTSILPLVVRRPLGRPPIRRKRSRFEVTTRLRKCTRCGGIGHNRSTCLNPMSTQWIVFLSTCILNLHVRCHHVRVQADVILWTYFHYDLQTLLGVMFTYKLRIPMLSLCVTSRYFNCRPRQMKQNVYYRQKLFFNFSFVITKMLSWSCYIYFFYPNFIIS